MLPGVGAPLADADAPASGREPAGVAVQAGEDPVGAWAGVAKGAGDAGVNEAVEAAVADGKDDDVADGDDACRIDALAHEVVAPCGFRDEQEIGLNDIERRALRVLMQYPGEGLSHRFISERVLGEEEDWRALTEVMESLRQRVDDPFERKLIHTIEGVGYVLR